MRLTKENIIDNEVFEYTGDVTILGNIGSRATITIKNGSLYVGGNIGARTQINLTTTTFSSLVTYTMLCPYIGNLEYGIFVAGHLGKFVKINTKSADITAEGSIGPYVMIRTQNGNVNLTSVMHQGFIYTKSGTIQINNVGQGVMLKTDSGNMRLGEVGRNVSIVTRSGNLQIDKAHSSALIDSIKGEIITNPLHAKEEPKELEFYENVSII